MMPFHKLSIFRPALVVLMTLMGFAATAQTWTIGTGTGSNTTTSYPTPFGNFYWGNRVQFLYRASELTAQGMTAGVINQLGFEVTAVNTNPALTGFTIQIKNTATATLPTAAGAANWETGMTTVFGPQSYQPVAGWNMFTLTSPFTWNGTSNILVEVCSNNASFANNCSVRWTQSLAFNGSRTYRADAAGVCANTGVTASATPTTRSNIRFFRNVAAPPNCVVSPSPANGATNVPLNTTLSWQNAGAGGTPTSYDVTISVAGMGVIYGPTNQATNSFTLFQGIPLPANSTVTWTVTAINAQGNATGCSNFTFTTGSLLSYCATGATNGGDSDIGNVSFAGLNNGNALPTLSNPAATGTYTNFTNLAGASVMQGVTYPISVSQITSGATFYTAAAGVYFDWNQDGDFVDAGEGYSIGITAAATPTVTTNIAVPLTALAGTTTMRVVLNEAGTTAPCGTFAWGESEDYRVTVAVANNCSGQPNAGTASASPASVCSGVNFSLSATGTTIGQGINYQWQSSPDGTSWSNIGGATNTSYTANQAAATFYRMITNCTFSGQSNVTNSVQVTMQNFVNCYCASGATSTADDDIGNVTFAGINNGVANPLLNNPASANTYTNFTATVAPASVTQGVNYALTVTQINQAGFYACNVYAYFDWNQNGSFLDAGETYIIGTTAAATQQVSASIAVPQNATVGNTRMRIVLVETAIPTPCGTYTWGETEDYLVNVVLGVQCAGQPNAGTATSSPASVCSGASFNLVANGVTTDVGVSYQWQSSPDGVTWTNMAGATATTYSTTQVAATQYRLMTTCANSGQSNVTNALTVAMNSFFNCYCVMAHTAGCGSGDITNVTFNTLNNTTACAPPTVASYPATPPTTTSVEQFLIYPLSVTTIQAATIISVWIDWNQNGVYEASEWTQVSTNNAAGATATVNITVPGTALPGQTGMRIRSRLTGNVNGAANACTSMGSGEGEDYVITVLAGTPCVDPPTAGTAASNDVMVCSGQNFTLSVTGNTVGGGQTYQWQSSSDNVTWADIAGAVNTGYTTSQIAAAYYRLMLTCGSTVITNTVFVNMETILNCYCANNATSTADDDIGNVTFSNINNGVATPLTNNPAAVNTYTSFTATVSPAQVTQGNTYTLSVTQINQGGFYACGVRAFFDWNQDGDFVDAGEGYTIGTTAAGTQLVSASILVPATATPGTTGMRIVLTESGNAATMTPCGTYTWGETEDYRVNVSIPVQLDPYPFALTAPANQGCFSNAETVSVTVGNAGVAAINFATDNLTVTATVNGPNGTQTASAILTSGTLAANGTQVVTLSPTIDLSAGGAYTFSLSTSMATDGNAANNTLSATRTNITAVRPFNEGFAVAATPSGWTTPSWLYAANHGNGTNGIYQNLWAGNAGPAQFTLPPIGTVQAGDGFSFDYRLVDWSGYPNTATANAIGWGSIVVEVSTNCGGTWSTFATIDPGTHIEQTAWATKTYPLTAYVGQTVRFRITVNYASGDWYADFDNFNLTNCFPPTNLTISGIQQTLATATWTASGAAIDYQWELYQGVTMVQSGTTVGTTVNLTGLTANTAYSFRVRSNCGADQSAQVTVNFTSGRLGEDFANAADYTLTVRANQAACGGSVVTSGNAQNGPSNVGCSAGSGVTPDDDVWSMFVAPANGNKLIITTTGISNTDWVMQVWTNDPSNGGQVIGCSDDVNGLMPQIELCQFEYTAGQSYYVRAWTWGVGGSGATMNLCVYEAPACPLPPANDNCASAQPVPINQPGVCGTPAAVSVTGTTLAATASATPNTACAPFSTHFDVWYRFVSESCAPNYTATFQSAPGAAVGVALYQGNDCNTFTYAGCLANANGGFNLNNLTGGTVYYLRFYSTAAATSGSFTFCMSSTTAFPTNVIYVNDNAPGANTGANWYDAYNNLQTALAAATPGKVLYVAEGTYYPSTTGNRSAVFLMRNGINLYGGFDDGGAICNLADRDPIANPTILSGDLGVTGVNTDNSFRVVVAKNIASCELNGFNIVGANSTTNGGGIWLAADLPGQPTSVTIRRCEIQGNISSLKGGGLGALVANSSILNLNMDSCVFSNNIGRADGGGIGAYAFTNGVFNATLDRTNFNGNQALSGTSTNTKGGAITTWCHPGSAINLILLNSNFTNNVASFSGGALYLNTRGGSPTTLTVTGCTFTNNSAASGGAIFNIAQGGTTNSTITNSTFTGNSSNNFGGAICNYNELAGGTGNHTVTNCTFNNNIGGAYAAVSLKLGTVTSTITRSRFANNTSFNGGAFYLASTGIGSQTSSSITNCVFYNNAASRDGGAFHVTSTGSLSLNTNIHSCSFHSNDAARRGGAINNLVMKAGSSNITATNTIFWQNPTVDAKTRSFHNEGLTASTTVNFCMLDSICANNEVGSGPFTCNSCISGTNPMFVSAGTGNLALMAGSPAIDAGTATGAPAVDYNNGPRPQGAGFDIGAYESGAVAPRLAQENASEATAMDVKLFPNPTSGLFTLELGNLPTEEVTVQIFDMKGSLVNTRALFGENSAQFDLGGLTSGIYFVRIVAGDQISTQRVVLGGRP